MAKQKPPKQKREAKTQIGEAESRVVEPTFHSFRKVRMQTVSTQVSPLFRGHAATTTLRLGDGATLLNLR